MTKNISNILQLDVKGDFFNIYFRLHPLPMWVFDVVTLSILEVNDSAIRAYGYNRQEFLGMTIKDIRPMEDVSMLEEFVPKVGARGHYDYRWRHIKKDGSCIWVTITSCEVLFKGMFARMVTVTDVTRFREQETSLRLINKELGEYKTAVTTSSILSITNCQGIIQYANENFVHLTGYTRQELIGCNHNLVNCGYHQQAFWQTMWTAILGGKTWHGEICNRKKNGSLYWIDSFIIPVKNEEGQVERIFSIGTDITQRKNKEMEVANLNRQLVEINEDLTQSKKELEKLSLVARLTESEVMILDKDRRITWVNDAFTRLTGYTLAEAAGKRPAEFLHGPNSREETTQLIRNAIINKKPFKTEVIHYSKYGQEFCLLTDGQPVLDIEGNLLQYVIVETDITELKKKQQAIRNSEIKLNAFFSSTANLHLLVDMDLNILAYNKVAEEFAKDILHATVTEGDYLPAKIKQPMRDAFTAFASEAIKGNATINRHAEIVLDDGSVTLWVVHYLPAYDRSGNIIGCAFTAIDITERKKAENRINRQNAMLKEIAWKQSHIVRAPLANILSLTTLLETNGCDAELLTALKQETQKLDGIIKEIVDKTSEAKTEAIR